MKSEYRIFQEKNVFINVSSDNILNVNEMYELHIKCVILELTLILYFQSPPLKNYGNSVQKTAFDKTLEQKPILFIKII